MKHAAVIADVRQLCCLGLAAEALMPALLRELHEVVGCDSAAFFWVDQAGEMTNLCAERLLPPDVMRLYFSRFYDSGEFSFRSAFSRLCTSGAPVTVARFSESFFRSDYYNLIWRQLDACHGLYAVIRADSRALGQLSLYRTPKDRPFSAQDQERLATVTRYIAHAVCAPGVSRWEGRDEEGEASGLIILDRQHRLVHCSPQGRRLLFLATHQRISRSSLSCSGADIPSALSRLCADLDLTFKHEAAPPPVIHIETAWGRFVCRAYRLNAEAAEALTGITVQLQTPLPLLLLAGAKAMRLSAQQKQVVLLLARGQAHSEIARNLNISINTVGYHVKQIYNKLDVHDQSGMVDRLRSSSLYGRSCAPG